MINVKVSMYALSAHREEPDFQALRKHPNYKEAVKILHSQGLSPMGVRGYPKLLEVLQQLESGGTTKAKSEPLALAQMRAHLQVGLTRLQEAQTQAHLAQIKAKGDEEHPEYAAALREVQTQQQYVAGLRRSITLQYDRTRKQKK